MVNWDYFRLSRN